MKNRLIYVAVILCMIVSLVPVAISAPVIQATNCLTPPAGTLYVDNPDDGDQCPYCPHYDTIVEAITAASDGNTIIVYDGTYTENLDITKSLTIISVNGNGSTFISSGVWPITINFWANNIHLGAVNQGFDINGAKIWAYGDQTGGLIAGNSIIGNTIHDPDGGEAIRFDNGQYDGDIRDNVISGNTIYNCSNGISFDNCVTSYNTYNNTVQGNSIIASGYGIYFDNDDSEGDIYDNTVSDNTVHDCNAHGITFDNSWYEDDSRGQIYGNTVHDNTVYNCEEGITLYNDQLGDVHTNNISTNTVYGCAWGIKLYLDYDGNVSDNTVLSNTVHDCRDGIGLYDSGTGYGDVNGNTVDDNDVYNCDDSGIKLWSESIVCVVENTVSNNTVYGCDDNEDSAGILLYAGYDGNTSDNTVEANTVINCSTGITFVAEDDGSLTGNAVIDNTVYQTEGYMGDGYGIYLYTEDEGEITACTVQDNEVDGWEMGIYLEDLSGLSIDHIDILDNVLYNDSTGNGYGIRTDYCDQISIIRNDVAYGQYHGIYLLGSDNVYIQGNTVHDNDKGIYMEGCDTINIRGNDIRDNNLPNLTGIHILDSSDVTIKCNNIAGNGVGLYIDDIYAPTSCVYADYNWWGAADGPSGPGFFTGHGDEVRFGDSGCAYLEYWLAAELNLSAAPMVLNTEAVPATVSLYDMLDTYNDLYALGPAYTDLIVEIECPDNSCGIPAATVDLGAFLLDLLPADFEDTYVSTWSESWQEWWYGWLDYLSETEIDPEYGYYSINGTCFLDYELWLEDLFFEDYWCMEEGCYDMPCYDCFGLQTFFEAANSEEENYYEIAYEQLTRLIVQEVRTGQHQVEVTLESCGDISTTVYVAMVVADFQLPLEEGPNLRSTPVTLDPAWNNLSSIMGDGIDDIAAFVGWNSSLGRWVALGPDTVFTPLTAYYIIMEDGYEAQMRFVVERDITTPPTRTLQAGWNLVAPAPAYNYWPADYDSWPYCSPFPAMSPWDMLYSVEWTQAVVSHEYVDYEECFYYQDILLEKECYWKEFYQDDWEVYIVNEFDNEFVTAGGGYWVYMNISDLLAGFSYTPVPWTVFIMIL